MRRARRRRARTARSRLARRALTEKSPKDSNKEVEPIGVGAKHKGKMQRIHTLLDEIIKQPVGLVPRATSARVGGTYMLQYVFKKVHVFGISASRSGDHRRIVEDLATSLEKIFMTTKQAKSWAEERLSVGMS